MDVNNSLLQLTNHCTGLEFLAFVGNQTQVLRSAAKVVRSHWWRWESMIQARKPEDAQPIGLPAVNLGYILLTVHNLTRR